MANTKTSGAKDIKVCRHDSLKDNGFTERVKNTTEMYLN